MCFLRFTSDVTLTHLFHVLVHVIGYVLCGSWVLCSWSYYETLHEVVGLFLYNQANIILQSPHVKGLYCLILTSHATHFVGRMTSFTVSQLVQNSNSSTSFRFWNSVHTDMQILILLIHEDLSLTAICVTKLFVLVVVFNTFHQLIITDKQCNGMSWVPGIRPIMEVSAGIN